MDERLEKALDFSNYMVTMYNQKRSLKEKFYQDLIYYYNGAQFTVTKDLISFCNVMNINNQDEMVLVDDNDVPVIIDDLQEFIKNISDIYFTASNNYIYNYNKLKNNRSVEKLVDL